MKSEELLNKKSFCQDLRQRFLNDGYIFFPNFLGDAEIRELRLTLDHFIREKVQHMPTEQVYYEDRADKNSLKQLQQLFLYEPFFDRLMFGSKFERLASILLDDQVVGKNMQYFNKAPKIGKATPPHQDGYYFMLKPNEALTMWLALEKAGPENGCVRYVRGSHKKSLRPHGRTDTLGFSQGIVDFGREEDYAESVFHPARAGDLLVHHSLTIHWAEANASEELSRKALGFIYFAAKAREDKIAQAAYQKRLAEELAQTEKI